MIKDCLRLKCRRWRILPHNKFICTEKVQFISICFVSSTSMDRMMPFGLLRLFYRLNLAMRQVRRSTCNIILANYAHRYSVTFTCGSNTTLKGFSHLSPTSGIFTYLENWPPKFFVQNRKVLLVLFYGSFEYSRTSVLDCTLNTLRTERRVALMHTQYSL